MKGRKCISVYIWHRGAVRFVNILIHIYVFSSHRGIGRKYSLYRQIQFKSK